MPNYTTNFKLVKPLPDENYDVTVFNNNADSIDTALNAKISRVTGSVANNVPMLTNAGTLVDSGKNTLQLSNEFITDTLPAASEKYVNLYMLYTGPTENNLETNNYYKCIYDSALNTYLWEKLIVGITYTAIAETANIVGI